MVSQRLFGCKELATRLASLVALGAGVASWFVAVPLGAIDRDPEDYLNCRLIDGSYGESFMLVREEPDLASEGVQDLANHQRVTLASDWESTRERDFYGYEWVEIVEPVDGFIAYDYRDEYRDTLRKCEFAGRAYGQDPLSSIGEDDSLCVAVPEGLRIRQGARTSAAIVGGLDFGDRVSVVRTPRAASPDGRYWLVIDEPEFGYVSGGDSPDLPNFAPCVSVFRPG
ncbi:MAG: SH3 domain-containing protein [Geitlerinemataceae cyanobacterium]